MKIYSYAFGLFLMTGFLHCGYFDPDYRPYEPKKQPELNLSDLPPCEAAATLFEVRLAPGLRSGQCLNCHSSQVIAKRILKPNANIHNREVLWRFTKPNGKKLAEKMSGGLPHAGGDKSEFLPADAIDSWGQFEFACRSSENS